MTRKFLVGSLMNRRCCNPLAIEHATRLEHDWRESLPVLYQAALQDEIEQQRVITSDLGNHCSLRTRQITLFYVPPHGEERNDSWKRIVGPVDQPPVPVAPGQQNL